MPPATRKSTTRAIQRDAAEASRADQLSAFLASMNRATPGTMFRFNDSSFVVPDVGAVSTGAPSLDLATGIGGFPRGRITEVFGPESVGKTSLALSGAAQAIKGGGMAALIDAEHAINPQHLDDMGVDQDYFALNQPGSGEDALRRLEEVVQSNLFDLAIVDSVAALVPQAELNGEIGDQFVGLQARMLSQALRRLTMVIGQSKTAVIFINQLREKVGGYGNPETTPGGKALKFYASMRLDVRAAPSARIKDGSGNLVGLGTTVKVVKNKMAAPHKEATYELIWGKGINFAGSVFDVAKSLGLVVELPGYFYTNPITGEVFTQPGADRPVKVKGAPAMRQLFSEDRELAEAVFELCKDALSGRRTESPNDGPIPDSAFTEDAPAA